MANRSSYAKLALIDLGQVKQDFVWYAVVTQFNHEESFARNVVEGASGTFLQNYIQQCYIPIKYAKEKVVQKDGTVKDKIHKVKGCYSNYVFVKCIMNSEVWNFLRTRSEAAVILSTGGYPTEISPEEIEKIYEQQAPEGFDKEERAEIMKKVDFAIQGAVN